jgi:methyltransferase
VRAYPLLVGVVALQRLAEMRLSRRNAAWCREQGATDQGRRELALVVLVHAGLLAGSLIESRSRPPGRTPSSGTRAVAGGVLVAAQGVRWWSMRALGPRWTGQVLAVPGMPRVTSGPYRRLRHPNYVAVVAEGLALPLAGGARRTAGVFALVNTPLLIARAGREERLLSAAEAQAPR